MNKKIILPIFLLATLFLSTSCLASTNASITCVSSNMLEINTTYEITINDTIIPILKSVQQYCPNGCEIDRCSPTIYNSTFSLTTELFIIFIILFFAFIYMSWRFNASILGIMGSFFALIIGIITITSGFTIGEYHYMDAYTLMFGVFFIGIFMYVLASEAFG